MNEKSLKIGEVENGYTVTYLESENNLNIKWNKKGGNTKNIWIKKS